MSRFHGILLGVAVLFFSLLIALGAGVTSLILIERVDRAGVKDREAIERIDTLTTELSRLRIETNEANCISTNVTRDSIRDTIKDSLLALVPKDTKLTEEQEARIELYNKRVDAGLPFRDCSPEGIKAFLEGNQPDPALEIPDVD